MWQTAFMEELMSIQYTIVPGVTFFSGASASAASFWLETLVAGDSMKSIDSPFGISSSEMFRSVVM